MGHHRMNPHREQNKQFRKIKGEKGKDNLYISISETKEMGGTLRTEAKFSPCSISEKRRFQSHSKEELLFLLSLLEQRQRGRSSCGSYWEK